MSPMIYYEAISTRHEDLLKEAEKERLIKIAQSGQPSLKDRVQTKMGQILNKSEGKLHITKNSTAEGYYPN